MCVCVCATAANLAAMKALNSELLAKLSASQAGGPAAGDSRQLVQELREILASSKVRAWCTSCHVCMHPPRGL